MVKTETMPEALYSPRQLAALRRELQRFTAEWSEASRYQQIFGGGAQPHPSPDLAELLPSVVDKAALRELATRIETWQKLPVVHVTTAGPASESLRRKMATWFRTLRSDVLVEFHTDRTMSGGLLVRTPHQLHDWSWRDRLWEARGKLTEATHG